MMNRNKKVRNEHRHNVEQVWSITNTNKKALGKLKNYNTVLFSCLCSSSASKIVLDLTVI